MSDPGTDSTASALELIDQLEELLSSARRVPFSASIVVNEDEVLDLIDRARVALPDDLVQARHTLEDRDRLMASTEQEAEAILARADEDARARIADAEQRAETLTAESAIIVQAHARAEAVVTEAEARAASVREEADAYARELMQQLEDQLGRALATVRKGIESLPGARPRRSRKRD